jgi:hypothetical protein
MRMSDRACPIGGDCIRKTASSTRPNRSIFKEICEIPRRRVRTRPRDRIRCETPSLNGVTPETRIVSHSPGPRRLADALALAQDCGCLHYSANSQCWFLWPTTTMRGQALVLRLFRAFLCLFVAIGFFGRKKAQKTQEFRSKGVTFGLPDDLGLRWRQQVKLPHSYPVGLGLSELPGGSALLPLFDLLGLGLLGLLGGPRAGRLHSH